MARTFRDKNHTAAARAEREAKWDALPIGAYLNQTEPPPFAPRLRGGNMVMAPSVCGVWSDERPQRSADRKAQRRTLKRRERQNWRKDALDSAASGL